jgi:bifunctional DNA-binding transcriptional regulator/antitoxin component of YhaV-PrlF toxin-antitoxin module
MDSKGRVLIPLDVRDEIGADEFILERIDEGLLLKPIPRIADPIKYAKKIAVKDARPVKEIRGWIRKELEHR